MCCSNLFTRPKWTNPIWTNCSANWVVIYFQNNFKNYTVKIKIKNIIFPTSHWHGNQKRKKWRPTTINQRATTRNPCRAGKCPSCSATAPPPEEGGCFFFGTKIIMQTPPHHGLSFFLLLLTPSDNPNFMSQCF